MKVKKYGKPPCLRKANISQIKYNELVERFKDQGQWSQAFYVYLDTSREANVALLKNRGLRLRVRLKNNNYSLELKYKTSAQIIERTQAISISGFHKILNEGILPEGPIKESLQNLINLKKLYSVGQSNSIRKKINLAIGILVLDRTTCKLRTTYAIEYRSELNEVPPSVLNMLPRRRHSSKLEALWQTT